MVQENKKKIFVISPIGKIDPDGVDFTSLFLEEIVKPAAAEVGCYETPQRADEQYNSGSITARVVTSIIDSDVCVADLTGRNPNVMYEVAIAHAADKPVILMQQEEGGGPFDFSDERVIHYSLRVDDARVAREALVRHLQNTDSDAADERLLKTMHPVRVLFKDLRTREAASEPQRVILDRLDSIESSLFRDPLRGRVYEMHKDESSRAHAYEDIYAELHRLVQIAQTSTSAQHRSIVESLANEIVDLSRQGERAGLRPVRGWVDRIQDTTSSLISLMDTPLGEHPKGTNQSEAFMENVAVPLTKLRDIMRRRVGQRSTARWERANI